MKTAITLWILSAVFTFISAVLPPSHGNDLAVWFVLWGLVMAGAGLVRLLARWGLFD